MADEREIRLQRLHKLREKGIDPYPNRVERTHTIADVLEHFNEWQGEQGDFTLTGRIRLMRDMGKAAFAQIEDGTGRIQVFFRINDLGEDAYKTLKLLDIGDFVQVRGYLFVTKTGERTLHVRSYRLLAKGLRPLPEKYHGLEDVELRQRKRYLDLIANGDEARRIFIIRSRTISAMRRYLDEHGFIEVETPMLHPIPGGANARPFVTHHNALDQQMFLRIAPELYLKRLVVGGFERVFEINRSFRNEGISVRHNPEFTMLEFYAAYWDHRDLMDFTEDVLRHAAREAAGSAKVSYAGREVDLEAPFTRMTVKEAIVRHGGVGDAEAGSADALRARLRSLGADVPAHWKLPELQFGLFEEVVEEQLWNPTFIVDYPVEVSPLARASDRDPTVAERFELFITGREFANGFSELNDAEDQAARFRAQAANKEAGDEEAMYYDADFIRALEIGMPPTGGCGIGIDRVVMLLTDAPSIRDVLLFPALRNEG